MSAYCILKTILNGMRLRSSVPISCLFLVWASANAQENAWKEAQLADALTAAPRVVTDTANIYAWNNKAELVLIREGQGPFVCVASGLLSTRVGKPALPFPDPACFDQNAWAFFQAFWKESNPMKPSKPYPTAPGVVWMMAGMAVADGMAKVGTDRDAEIAVMDSGKKIVRLSPHLMIMPLPVKEGESLLTGKYQTDNPHANWTMFASTPLEHLMVHFTDEEKIRIMQP